MARISFPLFLASTFLAALHLAHATQVLVPSYFYPGTLWTQSIQGGAKTGVMIANPNNGPGSAADSAYATSIKQAQLSGVKVVGYVHITYGNRDQSLVLNDINNWYRFYPTLDGIFFDETPAGASGLAYVQTVSTAVRQRTKNLVMLNPGIYPDQGYMKLGDILLVFEGSYSSYASKSIPTWVSNYDPSQFYHVVYACTSTQMANSVTLAQSRRAQYVFITDDVLTNPYDSLPTYWSSLLSKMAVPVAPAPAPTPAPTPTPIPVPVVGKPAFNGANLLPSAWSSWAAFGSGFTVDTATQRTAGNSTLKLASTSTSNTYGAFRTATFASSANITSVDMSCYVKASSVAGSSDADFSMYLDITHTDGTYTYGRTVNAGVGTYGWTQLNKTVVVGKPIQIINVYLLFRRHVGTVWFDSPYLAATTASAVTPVPAPAPCSCAGVLDVENGDQRLTELMDQLRELAAQTVGSLEETPTVA